MLENKSVPERSLLTRDREYDLNNRVLIHSASREAQDAI